MSTERFSQEQQNLAKIQQEILEEMNRQNSLQEEKVKSEQESLELIRQQILQEVESQAQTKEHNELLKHKNHLDEVRIKLIDELNNALGQLLVKFDQLLDDFEIQSERIRILLEFHRITIPKLLRDNTNKQEINRLVDLLHSLNSREGHPNTVNVGTNIGRDTGNINVAHENSHAEQKTS